MGRASVDALRGLFDVTVVADLIAPDIAETLGLPVDVSDASSVQELAEQVRGTGTLLGLVHAAGISPTMGDARRIFEVNLVGTQLVLDAFAEQVGPGTAAVCFSSSAAYQVAPFVTAEQDALLDAPLAAGFFDAALSQFSDPGFAYAMSKRGVIRAAGRAAVEWGRRGGRVNSVAPGIIDTPMGRQELAGQPMMRDMLAACPAGRMGEPADVANVVRFLLSAEASYVSGIDVLVDGGMVQGLAASAG